MCNFSVILFNNYKQTLFFFWFFPCIHTWIIMFVFVSVSIAKFQLGIVGSRCPHTLNSFALACLLPNVWRVSVCLCFVWICVCVCDAAVKASCVRLLRKPADRHGACCVPGKEMLACEGRLPRRPKRKFYCFWLNVVGFFFGLCWMLPIECLRLFVVVVVVLSIVKRILSVFFLRGNVIRLWCFLGFC